MIVAIIAFPGISPFHLAAPCVVFGEAHPGLAPATLRICAETRAPLRSSAGFRIEPSHGLRG